MWHLIEFCTDFTVDLEISRKQRLERLRIRKGLRVYASLRHYVAETPGGPVEVADLYFEDGSVTRGVPCERFRFVE